MKSIELSESAGRKVSVREGLQVLVEYLFTPGWRRLSLHMLCIAGPFPVVYILGRLKGWW
jgi:hypothetical protein